MSPGFFGNYLTGYSPAVHFPDTGMAAEAGRVFAEAENSAVDKVFVEDMAFAAGMEDKADSRRDVLGDWG